MCTRSQRTEGARFELLAAVLTKAQVVWFVTAFRLASSYRRFGEAWVTISSIQQSKKEGQWPFCGLKVGRKFRMAEDGCDVEYRAHALQIASVRLANKCGEKK
jgi:hypothetical protein